MRKEYTGAGQVFALVKLVTALVWGQEEGIIQGLQGHKLAFGLTEPEKPVAVPNAVALSVCRNLEVPGIALILPDLATSL